MNATVSSYSMSALDLSIRTSSGDEISLGLYSKESLSYESDFSSKELTLTKERGIRLHYEGNGLDERDKKEIAEALKQVQDILDQFLSPKEMQKSEEEVSRKILDVISPLKEPENEEKNSYLKNSLTDLFNEIFKNEQNGEDILKTLDNVFKSVLDEFDPFSFYA